MKDTTVWAICLIALAIFSGIVYGAYKAHLLLILLAVIVGIFGLAIWFIRNNTKK